MNWEFDKTTNEWFDPDDAPELTEEWFARATPMIGEQDVTWEEFRRAMKDVAAVTQPHDESKVAFVFRLDSDIFNAFAATGENWEAQMNAALREWMIANLPS